MKRGSRLFSDFVGSDKPVKTGSKGRSGDLLKIRNEKILFRYYYHSRILQFKYERVLFELSKEFDLSESTIIKIIEKNADELRTIGNQKLNRGQLKKRYPFYCWSNLPALLNKDVTEREVFVLR